MTPNLPISTFRKFTFIRIHGPIIIGFDLKSAKLGVFGDYGQIKST